MNVYKFAYFSYGTIYGTVRNYNSIGEDIGPLDLTGYGIFFAVRKNWFPNAGSVLISKSIGNGITITDGTLGQFVITFNQNDLRWTPNQYVWDCFVSPQGTAYVDGTTAVKSIGTGIFEITEGVKWGTV